MKFEKLVARIRSTLALRQFASGKFAFNVGSTVIVQVLSLIISLANAAIIARVLGVEGKGILQLALMMPALLGLFLNGGIGVANAHFIGKQQFDVATLTSNSIAFTIIATLLGGLLIGVLAVTNLLDVLVPGLSLGLFLLAMIGLPLAVLSGYLSTIVQGLQKIVHVNGVRLFVALLNLILLALFLYYFQLGIAGAVCASLLSSLISIIVFASLLSQNGAKFVPDWNRNVMKETLRFGLLGYFGNVLQYFNYRLDVLIMNFFLGPASVGIYGVAVRLAELVWYFPNAVSFVIFPKAASSSSDTMNRFTPRVFNITLLISILAGVVIALIGKPLINLVYTEEFGQAFLPLLVLLPGVVLLGAARVLTSDIAGRGYPQYNSINSATALIVTIILDIILIPELKILGASIASTAAYTVTFIMSIIFYRMISRKELSSPAISEGTAV